MGYSSATGNSLIGVGAGSSGVAGSHGYSSALGSSASMEGYSTQHIGAAGSQGYVSNTNGLNTYQPANSIYSSGLGSQELESNCDQYIQSTQYPENAAISYALDDSTPYCDELYGDMPECSEDDGLEYCGEAVDDSSLECFSDNDDCTSYNSPYIQY
jgi:hypothetical protein